MKINFVTLRQIKNWLSLFFICAIVCLAFILLRSEVYRFNPQYLVDNSIFKDKDFSVEVKEIKSPKLNLSAYLFEEHSNPIVSVSFMFLNSGTAYDAPSRNGEAKLLSAMLTAGAGKYDMKRFHSILEQKAIDISFFSDYDSISGVLKFIKKDIDIATNLFNLSITRPRFDNKYLEQNKNIIISNIRYQMEQVDSSLYAQSLAILFGKHPYGRNPYGNIKHLSNIQSHHLKEFMKKHLTLNNLIIGISGDVTEAEAIALVERMFSGLPKNAKGHSISDVDINFSAPMKHISRDSIQNIGSFWALGPTRQSSDFYPTYIATQILFGNGLGSRMYKRARETEGLTYGVYGGLTENDKISFINGEFSSTSDKFSNLLEVFKDEWQKMGKEGITEQELEQTKNSLISSHALRYADIHNISNILVYMQKEQLGLDFLQKRNDYIRNVNIEDVNNIAKKYFINDNLRFITIGDTYIEE